MTTVNRISETEVAVAQAILASKNIIQITPQELASLLQIDSKRAGMILRRLSWRRERYQDKSEWFKEGAEKIFPCVCFPTVKMRARRLGVLL